MTFDEVVEELEDLLFSLKVEEQINPRSEKTKKQKEAIVIAINCIKEFKEFIGGALNERES